MKKTLSILALVAATVSVAQTSLAGVYNYQVESKVRVDGQTFLTAEAQNENGQLVPVGVLKVSECIGKEISMSRSTIMSDDGNQVLKAEYIYSYGRASTFRFGKSRNLTVKFVSQEACASFMADISPNFNSTKKALIIDEENVRITIDNKSYQLKTPLF